MPFSLSSKVMPHLPFHSWEEFQQWIIDHLAWDVFAELLKRCLGGIVTIAVLSLCGLVWSFVGQIPLWLQLICAFVLTLCAVAILLEIRERVTACRKKTKDVLGKALGDILDRLDMAERIDRYHFADELYKKEWTMTGDLFLAIETELAKALTLSEAGLFRDAPVAPLPDTNDYGSLNTSMRNWQWHINVLMAKRDELKRIIEKQG